MNYEAKAEKLKTETRKGPPRAVIDNGADRLRFFLRFDAPGPPKVQREARH